MGQSVKKNQFVNNAYWLSGYAASMTEPDKKELIRRLNAIEDQLLDAAEHIDEDGFYISED